MQDRIQPHDVRAPRGAAPAVLSLLTLAVLLGLPAGLQADFAVFRAPSRMLSLFALPGESVPFDLITYAGASPGMLSRFTVEAPIEVDVAMDEARGFLLTGPTTPGIYTVTFQERREAPLEDPLPYTVQLVVLIPDGEIHNGRLGDYPIGRYPRSELEDRWRYERPRGFVEITEANRDLLLTDHFHLSDLDCKLEVPYPHYAAIQTAVLIKLEGMVDILRARGLPGEHIQIMSGYRTPDYNRSLGNRTRYSRHIVGDAADVYLDADGDERMDDLNGDGRVNRRDAIYLLGLVNEMDNSSAYGSLVGGASAYSSNHDHGPFVHVDTRGFPARW
jgi:hypothetical protein